MRKQLSKSLTTILCGAMIMAAAGCGNTTGYPLNIDGVDVRAGIYIMEQQSALSEAQSKLKEEQPDLDTSAEDFDIRKQTIEGISAEEWIKNKTFELCRQYVATGKLFDELGLTLTAEDISDANAQAESMWTESNMFAQYFYGVDVMGEYYESIGVSQQSYNDLLKNGKKSEAIFEYYYGENGVEKPDEKEIEAKVLERYFAVNYFSYDSEVGGETAEERLSKLNSGESFESVYKTYTDDQKKKELSDAKKEAEEKGETYEGDLPENVDTELPEKDSRIEVIDKESTGLEEAFVTEAYAMKPGENKIIEVKTDDDTTITYIVQKADLSAMSDKLKECSDSLIKELKGEELTEKIKAIGDGYALKENSAATSLYKIDKLL